MAGGTGKSPPTDAQVVIVAAVASAGKGISNAVMADSDRRTGCSEIIDMATHTDIC